MFIKSNTDKTKTLKTQAYKPGMRLPIFSANSLLANKQHQFLLDQLREFSQLESGLHEELYQNFIHRFVEFVQVLPRQADDPLCSLMNDSLMRGINALNQFILTNKQVTSLERYAMFTAATLVDVAAVVINQKVFMTDKEGVFVKQWEPFSGAMIEDSANEFYKIMPLSSTYLRSQHSITPLLARQIMPEKGFLWIASDLKIFTDWLDALHGDDATGAGRFTRIIQLFMHNSAEGLVNSLSPVNVVMEESPATVHADAFFSWLKEGLATNQIKVNTADAGVHVTTEGVFLEKAGIFKQFVDLYNVPVNMFSVYQQFGNLFGLTKLSGADYRIDQLFSEYPDFAQNKNKTSVEGLLYARPKQIREGVIIADPSLVFTRGEIPAATPFLKPLPANQKPQNLPQMTEPNHSPENTR